MSNPIDDVPRDLKRLIMSFHDPRSDTAKCIGDLLWLFQEKHPDNVSSNSYKPNENYLAGEDYGRMYGNYLYGKCRPVLKKV